MLTVLKTTKKFDIYDTAPMSKNEISKELST